jgi:3'-phosphoadenosine 5'-phosphosulfate sulfotransferase (PAPS reductase)/FAD synthetase
MDLPDFKTYHWILINSSAGKDSQAMLDHVVRLAKDIRNRIVVVHADLERVEWKGTRELAEEHARHYGLKFIAVSRPQGDLLYHIRSRGMFPDPARRYCTSDHKRAQVRKVITMLDRKAKAALGAQTHVRILNCMGLRADESPARAKKDPFLREDRACSRTRTVDTWLPIHDWSEGQVWKQIKKAGTRYHHAYDLGMPRLSCCFCIFAPKSALMIAGKHNPELLNEYIRVEEETGHRFKKDLSLKEVRRAIEKGEVPKGMSGAWNM